MKKCPVCIVVAFLAGLGALNWLLVAYFDVNVVTKLLGDGTIGTKVAYTLVGIAGAITLLSIVKACPCTCKKT